MKTQLLLFLFILFAWRLTLPQAALAQPLPSNSYSSWISNMGLNSDLTTISGIINAALPLILVFAGLILFGMLIMSGYQMLFSAGNPKSADAGKQRLIMALVGFLVVFAAYWLTQIIQIIFGVNIVNN